MAAATSLGFLMRGSNTSDTPLEVVMSGVSKPVGAASETCAQPQGLQEPLPGLNTIALLGHSVMKCMHISSCHICRELPRLAGGRGPLLGKH